MYGNRSVLLSFPGWNCVGLEVQSLRRLGRALTQATDRLPRVRMMLSLSSISLFRSQPGEGVFPVRQGQVGMLRRENLPLSVLWT